MSTEPYPGLHYFCVDVETSALRPWDPDANLLSIGAVVLDKDGNAVDDFYMRVRVQLHDSWYDESIPARTETQSWWRDQNDYAKDEAFRDRTLHRVSVGNVAQEFRNFALQYGEEWTDRFFVASPDKFDWLWTDFLFSTANLPDPFWYHGIDVWSLQQGRYAAGRKGANKGKIDTKHRPVDHEPLVPHHALYDAYALAQDLCEFLPKSLIDLDIPTPVGYTVSAEVAEDVDDEDVESAEEEAASDIDPVHDLHGED